MIKKLTLSAILFILIATLTGCVTAGTPSEVTSAPVEVTSAPGEIPPTQTAVPSATPIPPTETPTAVPPTATPTIPPEDLIQHFTTGQKFTVTYIHMIDANAGWAIGGLTNLGNHVLSTTDGGETWKDVTPPETAAVTDTLKTASGFFVDAQKAWVVYSTSGGGFPIPNQVVVWQTQDGGQTWQASQPLDLTGLNEFFVPSDLQFVQGQFGWMLAHVGVGMMHDYVALYRSTDGGSSWTRILDPYNDGGIQSCSKSAMIFTDATHGWLTGDCNGVKAGVLLYKSTDAGSTWQEVSLPAPTDNPGIFDSMTVACGAYYPFFFSNDLGYMSVKCANFSGPQVANTYYIYSTLDGGSTWTEKSYPGAALYFISPDTGWAISQQIQLTIDGGLTWKVVSNVTWNAQLDFINTQTGWAVATANNVIALVKTDNGGVHWSILTPVIGQ